MNTQPEAAMAAMNKFVGACQFIAAYEAMVSKGDEREIFINVFVRNLFPKATPEQLEFLLEYQRRRDRLWHFTRNTPQSEQIDAEEIGWLQDRERARVMFKEASHLQFIFIEKGTIEVVKRAD